MTPLQSICKNIAEQTARGRDIKEALLIWSARHWLLIDSVCDLLHARNSPNALRAIMHSDAVVDPAGASTSRRSGSCNDQQRKDGNVNGNDDACEHSNAASDARAKL